MNSIRFSFLCVLVAGAVAGCKKDATFQELMPPQAALHWVNAVPDTGVLDIRPIDIITNAALMDAPFRSGNRFYQGIDAGTRRIRAFLSSSDPAITGVPILDTTVTLSADNAYSLIYTGYTRASASPARRLLVVPDAPPTPGPGQIAIRVVNAAPSLAGASPAPADTTMASDVFIRTAANITAIGTPAISSVAYGLASTYAVVDTGRYWLGLRAAGTTEPIYAQVALVTGTAGDTTNNPIAGTRVAGSALTFVLLPRSVPGTGAPQGGRPAAVALELMTRSNDTVTAQSGSISRLVNRSPAAADSTVGTTGTGVSSGTTALDQVLIAGVTEPEYNGWKLVTAVADSLSCVPADSLDTATRCNASNAIATTRFRFRYRIAGTPTSPATGTATYRIYTASTADFTIPTVLMLVDRRPPNTIPER